MEQQKLKDMRQWLHTIDDQGTPLQKLTKLKTLPSEIAKAILSNWDLMRREDQYNLDMLLSMPTTGVCNVSGRALGKSYQIANIIVEALRATHMKNFRIAVLAPTFAMVSKINYNEVWSLLTAEEQETFGSLKNKEITNPANNNSVAFFSATNPDRLRGETVSLVVMDEGAFFKSLDAVMVQVNAILRGTSTNTKYPFLSNVNKWIMVTTPVTNMEFINITKQDDITLINSPSSLNYFLPYDFVERNRKAMSDRVFKTEILAQILDSSPTAVVTPEQIIKTDMTLMKIGAMDNIYVSVDPAGSGKDAGAVVVVGTYYIRGRKRLAVLESLEINTISPTDIAIKAIELANHYNASAILSESNGAIGFTDLVEHIASMNPKYQKVNVIPVHSKTNNYLKLEQGAQLAFEHGLIEFSELETDEPDKHRDLVSQLLNYDGVAYRDAKGFHWDLLSAFAQATLYIYKGYTFGIGLDVGQVLLDDVIPDVITFDASKRIQDRNQEQGSFNPAGIDENHEPDKQPTTLDELMSELEPCY